MEHAEEGGFEQEEEDEGGLEQEEEEEFEMKLKSPESSLKRLDETLDLIDLNMEEAAIDESVEDLSDAIEDDDTDEIDTDETDEVDDNETDEVDNNIVIDKKQNTKETMNELTDEPENIEEDIDMITKRACEEIAGLSKPATAVDDDTIETEKAPEKKNVEIGEDVETEEDVKPVENLNELSESIIMRAIQDANTSITTEDLNLSSKSLDSEKSTEETTNDSNMVDANEEVSSQSKDTDETKETSDEAADASDETEDKSDENSEEEEAKTEPLMNSLLEQKFRDAGLVLEEDEKKKTKNIDVKVKSEPDEIIAPATGSIGSLHGLIDSFMNTVKEHSKVKEQKSVNDDKNIRTSPVESDEAIDTEEKSAETNEESNTDPKTNEKISAGSPDPILVDGKFQCMFCEASYFKAQGLLTHCSVAHFSQVSSGLYVLGLVLV